MKTVNVKSFFRKVKDAGSVHYGKKRPDLEWSFDGYTDTDLQSMALSELSKVATILNDSLEKYGKNLLLKNGEDWEYVPVDVTVNALFADIMAETTRTRTVTKESLALAGNFYEKHAHIIGKLPAAAKAGNNVIAAKLSMISGNADSLRVMLDSIDKFILVIPESLESANELEAFETSLPVFQWLSNECAELIKATNIVDSL
jgi:hypothetical protein